MPARKLIASAMEIEIRKTRSVLHTDTALAAVHYENVKLLSALLHMLGDFEYKLVADESDLACVD